MSGAMPRVRQSTDGCRVRLSGLLLNSNASILKASCRAFHSFSLIWPVIISGTQVYGTNRTMIVMDVLDAFRGQCE